MTPNPEPRTPGPEIRPRVLVIEDEAGLRLTLNDRLTSEGYQVDTATDGEAGLEGGSSGAYDLIVLDVMLPRMNGFDVCRELRHRGAALSRDALLAEVWGYDDMPLTRTVDVHVAGLRQKIEANPKLPAFILTVHGLGYKFVG